MRKLFLGGSVGIGRGRTTDNSIDLVDLGILGSTTPVQRPRSIRWLVFCGALLIGVIAVGTALMVDYYRERTLANSKRELGNTALLLAYVQGKNAAGRIHEGEFADVGATVNTWLGGKAPSKRLPGQPIVEP